jgi:hypothetical protein
LWLLARATGEQTKVLNFSSTVETETRNHKFPPVVRRVVEVCSSLRVAEAFGLRQPDID